MMPLTVSAQDSKCNTTPASVVHKVSQGNLQVIDWSQGRRDAVVIKIRLIASDNKQPVTSVDVRLLGTDKHTSTGLDGYFAVKVPINGTLRVSRFGVEAKVLKVRSLLKLKKKIVELEMNRYIVGEIAAPSSERISDSDSPTSHVEKNK
ncbi:peptidase associated/transthyretin-like domain-containing protein [Prevotella veroralis]